MVWMVLGGWLMVVRLGCMCFIMCVWYMRKKDGVVVVVC